MQFQWVKDGKVIASEEQLVLKETTPENDGRYTCVVQNEAGRETTDLQITVQCKIDTSKAVLHCRC